MSLRLAIRHYKKFKRDGGWFWKDDHGIHYRAYGWSSITTYGKVYWVLNKYSI